MKIMVKLSHRLFSKLFELTPTSSFRKGNKHWHLFFVLSVWVSQLMGQVPFFKEFYGYQDVGGSHDGKIQMPYGHHGSSSKGNDKSQHQRMPDQGVKIFFGKG